VIYQIWMQEPPAPQTSFEVRISDRQAVGGGLTLVELEVPPNVAEAHTRPGQYVWLGSWFVLASPPGNPKWEVVLRPAGEAAIQLVNAPIGTAVPAAGPFGDGFPTARSEPLVIAATAGAIAAVRTVMIDRIDHGDATKTHLYLGVSTRDHLPMQTELARWVEAGAEIVPCISTDNGRVQDVARSRLVVPRGTVLLLAGQPGMIEAMQELARLKGLAAYVNY
jgi:NAD(P)H-flavin reductase